MVVWLMSSHSVCLISIAILRYFVVRHFVRSRLTMAPFSHPLSSLPAIATHLIQTPTLSLYQTVLGPRGKLLLSICNLLSCFFLYRSSFFCFLTMGFFSHLVLFFFFITREAKWRPDVSAIGYRSEWRLNQEKWRLLLLSDDRLKAGRSLIIRPTSLCGNTKDYSAFLPDPVEEPLFKEEEAQQDTREVTSKSRRFVVRQQRFAVDCFYTSCWRTSSYTTTGYALTKMSSISNICSTSFCTNHPASAFQFCWR